MYGVCLTAAIVQLRLCTMNASAGRRCVYSIQIRTAEIFSTVLESNCTKNRDSNAKSRTFFGIY